MAADQNKLQEHMPHIIKQLRHFEKKNTRINIVKTVAISLILILLGFHLDGFSALSTASLVGFLWMISATVVFLLIYWKMQFQLDHLDMKQESHAFLRQASTLLEKQKWLFQWPFRLFVLAMLIGVNLTTYSSTINMPLWEKISLHLGSSATILMAFILGIKIRRIRFRKEIDPLLTELNNLRNELEDNTHA
ncbi:MAG: hypothetical protein DWQ10_06625 [Calditrichaeota bacterium]|nr:MAG: hypothetical protein DWQ10_06625 [Calditrichota bacterium]